MDFMSWYNKLVRLSLTDMSNCCLSNRPGENQGGQLENVKLVKLL